MSDTSCYVYGIIRARSAAARTRGSDAVREKDGVLPAGVGDPPCRPRTARYQELAALLSDVPADYHPEGSGVRGMRRDMRAHGNVLNHVIACRTILPFRFGVVFPSQEFLVSHVLEPQYQCFMRSLDQLDGTVELTLRATYVEPRALEEVVAANPRRRSTPP